MLLEIELSLRIYFSLFFLPLIFLSLIFPFLIAFQLKAFVFVVLFVFLLAETVLSELFALCSSLNLSCAKKASVNSSSAFSLCFCSFNKKASVKACSAFCFWSLFNFSFSLFYLFKFSELFLSFCPNLSFHLFFSLLG